MSYLLKVKFKKHKRAIAKRDIETLDIADYTRREIKHYTIWDEDKIIDKEYHWKGRKIWEAVYIKMLEKCISWTSTEFNSWFLLFNIKDVKWSSVKRHKKIPHTRVCVCVCVV